MIERRASHLLTDIEGTTTDIAFVHRTLFPYARARMADFVKAEADQAAVAELLDGVARRCGAAVNDRPALIAQLCRWIDEDQKVPELKALQGLIWERGYRDGDFTGHVYPDAYQGLRRWREAGIRLNVYSSGSVKAQQLLFGYSDHGDLRHWFGGWFDTAVGAKQETHSYRRIAEQLAVDPARCLFLSDVPAELDAASAAGMQAILLDREAAASNGTYPIAHSFDEIDVSP